MSDARSPGLLGRLFRSKPKTEFAKPKGTPNQRFIREWVAPITMVVAVMMPIRSSIADWNDVPSGSMRPTILEGDRIYVNKLAYGLRVPFTTTWLSRWSSPTRGEIVTFASPADGTRLVKRIVGVPGDRIAMIGNRLMINGEQAQYQITDDHATALLPGGKPVPVVHAAEALGPVHHAIAVAPGMASPASSFQEIVVPEGMYFVLGDNRDMSNDSRFIGFVPLDSIYGRSGYVALSVDPQNSYMPRWDRFLSELK
jgi:signal peptidase I